MFDANFNRGNFGMKMNYLMAKKLSYSYWLHFRYENNNHYT